MAQASLIVVHAPLSVAHDFIDYPYFADLGAVQLAGALRGAGHRVELVDGFALPGAGWRERPDGRADLGAPVAAVLEAVAAAADRLGAVDAVVFTLTPFHRPGQRCDRLAATVSGVAAALDATLLLCDAYQSGQHYLAADGDRVLGAYPEARAWVQYEAEVTVAALADRLAVGEPLPPGVHAGARADLDALPLPAWDLVDLAAYDAFHASVVAESGRGPWAFPIDGRTLPLVTSRGCPFSCVHCSSNPDRALYGKDQRRLGSARLVECLDQLTGRHHATRLAILDDLANASRGHFERLLSELSARSVRFDFPNGLRADHLERDQLAAMREAITTLSVSAESGSQRVIDQLVGKRLDLERVVAVARDAHDLGISLLIHFLFGLPGETAREINQTLGFALDLYQRYGARPALQYATPLPGTALADYDQVRALPPPEDWAPRFQHGPGHPAADLPADALARFKWTFDRRLEASGGPKKLILNLTYRCNNHCVFCAVGNRARLDANPAKVRDQLRSYRDLGVRLVDFDGGEPTLHPALIPLIGYAAGLGYQRIAVTTNGRLCYYRDFARRLVGSGLTTLLVSLHGADAATHARHVDVAEAFDQTVAGIVNCRRAAPPGLELGINTTITRYNADRLEAIAELVCDLGVGWLNLQFLTPFGRATVSVAPTLERAAEAVARLIDRFSDRLRIQVINLPFCLLPGYQDYLAGDLSKLERHMVFVDDQAVNLAHYLAERRHREPKCDDCPHSIFCGGFYDLVVVPDPPWPGSDTGTSSELP